MARYIDADLLHIQMEDLYEHHIEMKNFSADGAVADCLDLLDNVPTADVVEVVRCKDCKYRTSKGTCDCPQWLYDDINLYIMLNDFCSYGERKERG